MHTNSCRLKPFPKFWNADGKVWRELLSNEAPCSTLHLAMFFLSAKKHWIFFCCLCIILYLCHLVNNGISNINIAKYLAKSNCNKFWRKLIPAIKTLHHGQCSLLQTSFIDFSQLSFGFWKNKRRCMRSKGTWDTLKEYTLEFSG